MSDMVRKIYRLTPGARDAKATHNNDPMYFVDDDNFEYIGNFDPDPLLMSKVCNLLGASFHSIEIGLQAFKDMLRSEGRTETK